jgi:alkylglycerol monooxygenase
MAVPLFFGLMGVEYVWAKYMGLKTYTIGDTFSNLACGILQQVFGILVKIAFLFIYDWFHRNLSVQALLNAPDWQMTTMGWIVAFILIDFVYYWFHRFSHEINFLWAAHSVHHQSEEYNLSVALRQSAIQNVYNFTFFLSLAVVGIPTQVVVICYSINLIYQFWIHTRLIDKMGPLEAVMNTPSHHRVHHGVNLKYIDRNHAGVFIVWDRLFGTYQKEEESPVFGVTVPPKSWNPLWLQFQPYYSLSKDFLRTKKVLDKVKVWTSPPGWRPKDLGGFVAPTEVSTKTQLKYKTKTTNGALVYVLVQFLLLLAMTLALAPLIEMGRVGLALGLGLSVVVGLGSLAGVLEGRKWIYFTEGTRLAALLVLGIVQASRMF